MAVKHASLSTQQIQLLLRHGKLSAGIPPRFLLLASNHTVHCLGSAGVAPPAQICARSGSIYIW